MKRSRFLVIFPHTASVTVTAAKGFSSLGRLKTGTLQNLKRSPFPSQGTLQILKRSPFPSRGTLQNPKRSPFPSRGTLQNLIRSLFPSRGTLQNLKRSLFPSRGTLQNLKPLHFPARYPLQNPKDRHFNLGKGFGNLTYAAFAWPRRACRILGSSPRSVRAPGLKQPFRRGRAPARDPAAAARSLAQDVANTAFPPRKAGESNRLFPPESGPIIPSLPRRVCSPASPGGTRRGKCAFAGESRHHATRRSVAPARGAVAPDEESFNFVEGLIDHQILGIDHVLPGHRQQFFFEMLFLASGILLAIVGIRGPRPSKAGEQSSVPIPGEQRSGFEYRAGKIVEMRMMKLLTVALLAASALIAPQAATARDRHDHDSDCDRGSSSRYRHSYQHHHHHGGSWYYVRRYVDRHHAYAAPRYDRYGHRIDSHGHHVDRYGRHIDR